MVVGAIVILTLVAAFIGGVAGVLACDAIYLKTKARDNARRAKSHPGIVERVLGSSEQGTVQERDMKRIAEWLYGNPRAGDE